jgi:hypothetical protein
MRTNTINKIETKELVTNKGNTNGIFMALDIYDKNNSDTFIAEVINKFTMHKMISPPNTSILLITIIGDLSAEEFCNKWKSLMDIDFTAKTILSMLDKASVVHGTNEGKVIDEKSLL